MDGIKGPAVYHQVFPYLGVLKRIGDDLPIVGDSKSIQLRGFSLANQLLHWLGVKVNLSIHSATL